MTLKQMKILELSNQGEIIEPQCTLFAQTITCISLILQQFYLKW